MKAQPSASVEPPLLYTKNNGVTNVEDNRTEGAIEDDGTDSVRKLLTEIRDLLKIQVRNKEQDDYEDQRKDNMKKDWLLAAAVLDRICAIAFTIIFIAGTLTFIILFVTYLSS